MTEPDPISTAVSVVIPHYGDPAPTTTLVGQLRTQQGAPTLQILVVDDATPADVSQLAPLEGATVIRRERNGGFGAAVNTGIADAVHDTLLVLNSDLSIGPTFVADLLAAAAPWWPAVVAPEVTDRSGHPDPTARRFPRISHQVVEWLTPLSRWRETDAWHRGVGHDLRVLRHDTDPGGGQTPTITDWLVGAVLLMPTAYVRAVGGFDERFYMNSEEIDLQRRLRARGLPSVFVPTVSVMHTGGGSSDPQRRRQWLVDSRLAYAGKWGGRRRLQTALAGATAANLAWNTGRRVARRELRPWATARSEWNLLRGRP